jgi:ubiquinone/menaquinone biosynthesis C-methylase UbiE
VSDTQHIYRTEAQRYHDLVSREDYQRHLLPAIVKIDSLTGKDVIELGAGTGRLSQLIANRVKSLVTTDKSLHMLSFGRDALVKKGFEHPKACLASHRQLPFAENCADLVISGWSFCYAALDGGVNWQTSLEQAMTEVERVLRPGGTLVVIDSLGTGYETPNAPVVLKNYLEYLDQHGFKSSWIRTDYCFKNWDEAQELTTFFFGEDPQPMWQTEMGVILPECTGLWWKTFEEREEGGQLSLKG